MIIQWPLLFLISVFLSCLTEVQGLKCYTCHTNMKGCVVDVTLKSSEYLKDCAPTVLTCATFDVETKNYGNIRTPDDQKEGWIQRTCLYPRDVECFALDKTSLPGENGWEFNDVSFADQVECANRYRRQGDLPFLGELPASSLIRGRNPHPYYHVLTCVSQDGCNLIDRDYSTRLPFAKYFPILEHNEKKAGGKINCYSCNNIDNPYCIVKQTSSDKKSSHGEAYGCGMISIFKIGEGLGNRSSYFQRDVWYPGDHFCLERSFDDIYQRSGGAQESSIMHLKPRNDKGEEPCGDGEYERALKERNAENEYHWMGLRVFYAVEHFSAFLTCREQVKMKLGIYGVGFNLTFDALEAIRKHDTLESEDFYNKFAYVGFRFCGTQDLCNDWSDHQLYQELASNFYEPPTTTTDPTVTTTTPPPTTTTRPTKKGGGGLGETGDGCVKKPNKNMAMKQVPSFPVGILLLALLLPMTNARLIF